MADGGTLRALVVEDDPETAAQLKKIIERRFSLATDVAHDCATAHEMIATGEFDIVTLDYMLPDGRGIDLLQDIAAAHPAARAIMVTGHGDEETAVRSIRSSASGYVVKDAHLTARLIEALDKAVTEINLLKAEEELRQREERFRSLIENATDMIMVIDDAGVILYESPSVERALGYPPDTLVGENVFDFIHPDDRERLLLLIAQERENAEATVTTEYRFKHQDGSWRFMESVASNLLDDPSVNGIVVNSRDITMRRKNEELLAEYRDHLEQLVEARTVELRDANLQLEQEVQERTTAQRELRERAERLNRFLIVAHHELRHPVSVVKGYTTMLNSYLDRMSPEELHEILDAMNVSTDRLTTYIEELLDVSRIEGGRFNVTKQSIDPRLVVNTAADEMRVKGCRNEFAIEVDEAVDTVWADPERLARLILVLMDNAHKFSPPESTIEVKVSRKDGLSCFAVLDRGIGVPEGLEDEIFNRFYQVEDVKHHSTPGIGLGLYVGREIVSAHGGKIYYERREGGGSAFCFNIP